MGLETLSVELTHELSLLDAQGGLSDISSELLKVVLGLSV